jgi:tetratricopeptide (TPR) repeat protein
MLLMDAGRSEEALTLLEQILVELSQDADASILDIATAENSLAGALNNLGRSEQAVEHYWRAYQLFDDGGSELGALPRYNVAAIHVNAGRFEEARALLEEALVLLRERPSALMSAYVRSLLVDVEAERGALVPLRRHLADLDETLSGGHLADSNVKFVLERAAQRLHKRPEGVEPEDLARLTRLIEQQAARLGPR